MQRLVVGHPYQSASISVIIRICVFFVPPSISWKTTHPVRGFLVNNTEVGCMCSVFETSVTRFGWSIITLTLFPRTDLNVPSAVQCAPLRQYPLTRHRRNLFASPWQLSSGKPKRCMYFLSWARIDTARERARNDKAWVLHHVEDRPYFTNALYAGRA